MRSGRGCQYPDRQPLPPQAGRDDDGIATSSPYQLTETHDGTTNPDPDHAWTRRMVHRRRLRADSAPATSSSHNPTNGTGTAPPPTDSWSTSRSPKATPNGANTSPTTNTLPPTDYVSPAPSVP